MPYAPCVIYSGNREANDFLASKGGLYYHPVERDVRDEWGRGFPPFGKCHILHPREK
jgi:hypothetical protein